MMDKTIKLNPIYLENSLEDLVYILPTSTTTSILFRYSINRLELTDQQLKALLNDIELLKINNIWDVETEQQTLKQCKKNLENAEMISKLSKNDREKYYKELFKQFDI